MQQKYLDDENLSHYIRKIRTLPLLDSQQEFVLAKQWREQQSHKAIEKIINSHLRLATKLATGYRGYGLPFSDLIAEANIGLMQAIKHYDPEKGYRFSTYAMWWIRASIQEYVLHNWSLVKIGTTSSQKKLFFNLRKTHNEIKATSSDDNLTSEALQLIAKKLSVSEEEVIHMHQRLGARDHSLNSTVSSQSDQNLEWIEWLTDERENQENIVLQRDEIKKRKDLFNKALKCLNKREHQIIVERRLKEPPQTLEKLSVKMNISRERIRQLEHQAFHKLQKRIKNLSYLNLSFSH